MNKGAASSRVQSAKSHKSAADTTLEDDKKSLTKTHKSETPAGVPYQPEDDSSDEDEAPRKLASVAKSQKSKHLIN